MSLQLTFEIELNSDYHVGAGYGLGGGVDSALLRDVDGVPVLRGTMVAGLLRDALWRLLQTEPLKAYRACAPFDPNADQGNGEPRYCGQGLDDEGVCPVCRLFGSPLHAKHWQISSARPATPQKIGAAEVWRTARLGGMVTRRARVSPRVRRAEARKLFAEEQGDERLHFRFDALTSGEGEGALDEAALLVAAARNLRELGRSRQRGRGECLVKLIEPKTWPGLAQTEGQTLQDALLDRFAERWLLSTPPAMARVETTEPYAVEPGSAQTPVRLRLVVRTEEPMLIAERAEAGNQFETLGSIGGLTVRGALAQLAAGRFDLKDKTIAGDFRSVFVRGQVQFAGLLPAQRVQQRLIPTIPAPSNLLTCKQFPALRGARQQHDLVTVRDDALVGQCPTCGEALKPLDGFVVLHPASGQVKGTLRPELRTEMHIAIDPARGRVQRGALYGYVALEADQYFAGEVVCTSEEAWAKLQALTGLIVGQVFPLRMGKATRRGYGLVSAWLERLPDGAASTWGQSSTRIAQRSGALAREVMLTLLTDAIVTDTWGRYRQSFDRDWLARELDLPADAFEVHAAAATTRTVDGFNDQLGLPRWRDVALKAGSTVVLTMKANAPTDWEDRLARVERRGIGLRREDGFGSVAFNHPVYELAQGHNLMDFSAGPLTEARQTVEDLFTREDQWRCNWLKQLDAVDALEKELKAADGTPRERAGNLFAALAEWLHAQRDTVPQDIAQRLKQVGEPDEALKQLIKDYGARHKDGFFAGDGRVGLELISGLLETLGTKFEQSFWSTGVALLADRVAALAAAGRSLS